MNTSYVITFTTTPGIITIFANDDSSVSTIKLISLLSATYLDPIDSTKPRMIAAIFDCIVDEKYKLYFTMIVYEDGTVYAIAFGRDDYSTTITLKRKLQLIKN